MHYEILINKMNPDILKERVRIIGEQQFMEETVMHRILREKGVLSNYAATGTG